MPSVNININTPLDPNEVLFNYLLNNWIVTEQNFFSRNEITQTPFQTWDINIEWDFNRGCDDSISLSTFNQPTIRLGKDFIKRMFKHIFYMIDFYASNIANHQIINFGNIVTNIKEAKFNYFKNDDIEWEKIENKLANQLNSQTMYNCGLVFLHAMHFVICHEMGHIIHHGSGANIEKQCDDEGYKVLIYLANTQNANNSNILWSIIGLLFAQTMIASKTKKNVFDKEEKASLSHPFTFDRILNTLKKITHTSNAQLFNAYNLDDYLAYLFISIIFLYYQSDYTEFLCNSYSFKDLCLKTLHFLHNERELLDTTKRLCPDEVIGFIENSNNIQWNFHRRDDYKNTFVFANDFNIFYKNLKNVGQPIVFVLESPHKSEFFAKGINTFAHNRKTFARPSNGYTKRIFDKYVDEVLSNLAIPLNNEIHPVIIINACKFQCSLGKKTSLYRSRVFKKFFEGSVLKCNKEDFNNRLKEIAPWYVISACTKGDNPRYILRAAVDSAIQSNGFTYEKAYHPSSWRKPNYRLKRP